jgi:CYTH domain-containing protein
VAREIERKFLVRDDSWRDGTSSTRIAQGYLSTDPARSVRVRLAGEQAWLTIKGLAEGISRDEFEYPIPAADARQLLSLCLPGIIDKTRHLVPFGGKSWEVDVFHAANEGLIVAEIELEHADESPPLPPWLGAEVTDDPRYFNSSLASQPFRDWA